MSELNNSRFFRYPKVFLYMNVRSSDAVIILIAYILDENLLIIV